MMVSLDIIASLDLELCQYSKLNELRFISN